jgi:hypothetical protein
MSCSAWWKNTPRVGRIEALKIIEGEEPKKAALKAAFFCPNVIFEARHQ